MVIAGIPTADGRFEHYKPFFPMTAPEAGSVSVPVITRQEK